MLSGLTEVLIITTPDGTVSVRGRGLSGLCGVNDHVTAARRIACTGANQFGEGVAVLFRREASEKTGWFDGSLPYAIDIDYWVRLLSWAPPWAYASRWRLFGSVRSRGATRLLGNRLGSTRRWLNVWPAIRAAG